MIIIEPQGLIEWQQFIAVILIIFTFGIGFTRFIDSLLAKKEVQHGSNTRTIR